MQQDVQVDAAAPVVSASRKNRRWGRSRFMVPNPAFDWYVGIISGTTIVITSSFGLLAWWYQQRFFYASGLDIAIGQPETLAAFARASLLANVVVILCSSLMVVLASMYLLHRIVGPVYRMKQHMQSILDGNPPRELTLRQGDQLTDICHTYNSLLMSLELFEPKPLTDRQEGSGESVKISTAPES